MFQKNNNSIAIKDRELHLKRYIGVKYFIEKTNYPWLWSIADDNIIITEQLDYLIQELNSKYDTNKDLVLLGHCISIPSGSYLQGGSGYIMSRKFAKKFLKVAPYFFSFYKSYDDVDFMSIMNFFNMSLRNMASPYMYGHVCYTDNNPFIRPSKCPSVIKNTLCYGNKLFPSQNLVGYHCSELPKLTKYFEKWKKIMMNF